MWMDNYIHMHTHFFFIVQALKNKKKQPEFVFNFLLGPQFSLKNGLVCFYDVPLASSEFLLSKLTCFS